MAGNKGKNIAGGQKPLLIRLVTWTALRAGELCVDANGFENV